MDDSRHDQLAEQPHDLCMCLLFYFSSDANLRSPSRSESIHRQCESYKVELHFIFIVLLLTIILFCMHVDVS